MRRKLIQLKQIQNDVGDRGSGLTLKQLFINSLYIQEDKEKHR